LKYTGVWFYFFSFFVVVCFDVVVVYLGSKEGDGLVGWAKRVL
jgi:hypothetical protein